MTLGWRLVSLSLRVASLVLCVVAVVAEALSDADDTTDYDEAKRRARAAS